MDETLKLIITPTLSTLFGFFAGIISYRYQSKRNRKIEHKAKILLLHHQLKETNQFLESQYQNIINLITTVWINSYEYPLLRTSALESTLHLNDKMLDDETYTAYSQLLGSFLKANKWFFQLKHSSAYLHAVISQIKDVAKKSLQENYLRKKKFGELYVGLKSVATQVVDSLNTEQDKLAWQPIDDKIFSYFTNKANSEANSSVEEMVDNFINPLIELSKNYSKFSIFIQALIEMSVLAKEIVYQNKASVDSIFEYLEPISKEMDSLKDIYNQLSQQEVRQLFK